MALDKFYDENKTPFKDRILNPRRIILLGPTPDYDYSVDLVKLGLDKREVNYLYPKAEDATSFMLNEVKEINPKLTVQVGGHQVSRKFPSIPQDGEITDRLKAQVEQAIGDKFVNFHHHDEYSIRDGLGTCAQLIKLLKAQQKNFCCVTNHGSIGGWVKQNSLCKKNEIKAIYGMEGYFNDFRAPEPVAGEQDEEEVTDEKVVEIVKEILTPNAVQPPENEETLKDHRKNEHIVLVAKTEEGFYNIIRIHNDAQLNGFYYKPRINKEALQKWGKGIIATSACLGGVLASAVNEDNFDEFKARYDFFKSCFDEFYLELTLIEHEEQIKYNKRMIEWAQKLGAKMIVTCDSHYLKPEHSETHDLLMLIRSHKTILDKVENKEEVWQFDVRNLFYRNYEQMKSLWRDGFTIVKEEPDETGVLKKKDYLFKYEDDVFTEQVFEEAILNTRKIALDCQEIKWDSTLKLPKMYDDSEGILRTKVAEGFKFRNLRGKFYSERLNFELDMICELGYADYFLMMDRIIRLAKDKHGDFAVGWGRGCFHPFDRVITGNKIPKYISEIVAGDSVIAHDRTIQQVEQVFEYDVDEDLIEIITEDGRVLHPTPDHKILIKTSKGQEWIEARNLKAGDDIVEVA